MDKEKAKKAAELAEKELHEEEEQKQIDLIKKAIKQTLEAIKQKEKERTKLNKEIKTLKQDIDNIRAGRLDLIAERQGKDDEAKKTSIIEVVKEVHHHHYDRWYEPYKIIWKEPYWTTYTDCGNAIVDTSGDYTIYNASDTLSLTTAVNCSIAKGASAGTYKLDSGDCVTLT
ncbi:hypothetical protein ES708_16124 [subsurface metagenome]